MEELHLQLKRHTEAQDSLNTKANALLVISGITASIILGFYGNMMDESNKDQYMIIIFVTLVCIVISIFLALLVFRPIDTPYPITSSKYINENGEINKEKIKKRCEDNIGDIAITASSYFKSMRNIESQNKKNGKYLTYGIGSYLFGIILWVGLTCVASLLSKIPAT